MAPRQLSMFDFLQLDAESSKTQDGEIPAIPKKPKVFKREGNCATWTLIVYVPKFLY